MQLKRGITPEHSSLPSTWEHLANIYRVPAVATNQARSCQEKGLPGAHTSSKLNPSVPAAFEAGPGSSAGAERLAKTASQGTAPRGTPLSWTRSLSALLRARASAKKAAS